MSFFLGVELGQVSDVTALAVVESLTLPHLRTEEFHDGRRIEVRPVFRAPDGTETRDHPPANFALRHQERIPAGVSYADVVSRVKALCRQVRGPSVLLDATGVGQAVVELFQQSGLSLQVFTLTAGDQRSHDGSSYRIPKKDIVSVTQVLLQAGRLKIAQALPHARLLARELVNFRFKVGHEKSDDALAWREGPDDDLVLALAIAVWQAEQSPGIPYSIVRVLSDWAPARPFDSPSSFFD
jgi:hypothetical protein